MEHRDPLKNFEAQLLQDKVITEQEIQDFKTKFDADMNTAIEHAKAAPEMAPDEIYDYLYAE